MDNPEGRILAVHAGARPPCAVIEVTTPVRCPRCAAGKGCGAGLIGPGSSHTVEAVLPGHLDLQEGDRVVIELAPDSVLRAAAIVYGVPLAGAVLGAAGAWFAGAGDLGAALAALAGIAVGLAAGRWRLQQSDCMQRFVPTVTARLPGHGAG